MKLMKRRLLYFILSFLCFAACGLIVAVFGRNPFIRGFVGDILVILLLYFFVKGFYDFRPGKLTIFILVLAFTTEFLQYLKLISIWGLEQNVMAQLTIGAVFDPLDLVAYALGAITAYFSDMKLIKCSHFMQYR